MKPGEGSRERKRQERFRRGGNTLSGMDVSSSDLPRVLGETDICPSLRSSCPHSCCQRNWGRTSSSYALLALDPAHCSVRESSSASLHRACPSLALEMGESIHLGLRFRALSVVFPGSSCCLYWCL